jgi:hypothetical protein
VTKEKLHRLIALANRTALYRADEEVEELLALQAEFEAWEPEGRVIEQINEVLDRFTYWTDDSNNADLLGDIVQILGRTDIPG